MIATHYLILASLLCFYRPTASEHEACKTVVWIAHEADGVAKSCWNLTEGNWFGGGSEVNPKWPYQNNDGHADVPAVTGVESGKSFSFDARFWLNSVGYSIIVPMDIPLYIEFDEPEAANRQFCLSAKNPADGPYNYWFQRQMPHLTYTICYANDVTNLTQFYLDIAPSVFRVAGKIPDRTYFDNPVWSTWPVMSELNKTGLLVFAEEIRRFSDDDASATVLRVGRGWESCLGEFQFDSATFPDPKMTTTQIRAMNFKVLLRAHPFIAKKCRKVYHEAFDNSFFVDRSPMTPEESNIEGETVSSVDFTDISTDGAVEWWIERLSKVVGKFEIDGLYFEYGQTFYLENDARLRVSPNYYSKYYAQAAAQFGDKGVVTVGVGTDRYPMFVEVQKRSSATWSSTGIKGVIPAVLQMGLSGYPFVLPDPIGGGDDTADRPEKKLYVRWLQLNTLLPTMHFSWQFWTYDEEVKTIAKDMMKLRKQYVDTIVKLAEEAATTGAPIVRPLWWIAPDDERAQVVDDQFLLGNDIIVAPVVDETDVRQVYIPKGVWKDVVAGEIVQGPTTVSRTVKLNQLLYFTRN